MNAITFPTPPPSLKLGRSTEKWAATLAEERHRLQEDQDALREREANLREYETRLRSLQAEIDAGRALPSAKKETPKPSRKALAGAAVNVVTVSPFLDSEPALAGAWEKLHRARELLEAEQLHLRDDRIAMRELEKSLKHREESLNLRETRLTEREAMVVAAMTPREVAAATGMPCESNISRFTSAPFKMAAAALRKRK